MPEMQKMIDGSYAPVAPHRDDIVECSDGALRARHEALFDCRGGAHGDDEARHEADVAIVTEVLDGVVKWSEDYHTGNGDYPEAYAYIVHECSHDWASRIEEWIQDSYGDRCGHTDFDDRMAELVSFVCDRIAAHDSFECEYDRSDYSAYSGKGCCLYSLDIGECEEQVDINYHAELKALHDCGALDDVLDDYRGEGYVSRSRRRVRNDATGRYEQVGRETYMPYEHDADHPTLLVYTMPGGQWHYVVSKDCMDEMIAEFFADSDGDDD